MINQKSEENLGSILASDLQEVFNVSTESDQPVKPNSTTTNNIDDLVFAGDTADVSSRIEDSSCRPTQSHPAIDACVGALDLAKRRMSSTSDNVNTSTRSDGNSHPALQFSTTTSAQQSQLVAEVRTTTIDNTQTSVETERHIMISYNRESSSDICEKIYTELKNCGYKVWKDSYDLHGHILGGMARGIQNSSIVLLCYNRKYFQSDYCTKEATYAIENHINFIPCRLEAKYRPDGWLGIAITGQMYVDFSPSKDFNESFKKLLAEIENIQPRSQTHPDHIATPGSPDDTRNVHMNNQIMRDQFNAIIREYKESINKSNHDLHLLEKEELCELIIRLRERVFNDNSSSSTNVKNNCEQQNQNNDENIA